jgi:hypothetical protein
MALDRLSSETSPGESSSSSPLIAWLRAGIAQNCPGSRGKNRNSSTASGNACRNMRPVMPAASRIGIVTVVW